MSCTQYNLPSTVRNDLRRVFPMTRVIDEASRHSLDYLRCLFAVTDGDSRDRPTGRLPEANRPTGRVATLGVYFLHDREMGDVTIHHIVTAA